MINPQPSAPDCPNCQTPMELKTKGNDKFWGCPNYQECGSKTIPYQEALKRRHIGEQKITKEAGRAMMLEEIRDLVRDIKNELRTMNGKRIENDIPTVNAELDRESQDVD